MRELDPPARRCCRDERHRLGWARTVTARLSRRVPLSSRTESVPLLRADLALVRVIRHMIVVLVAVPNARRDGRRINGSLNSTMLSATRADGDIRWSWLGAMAG